MSEAEQGQPCRHTHFDHQLVFKRVVVKDLGESVLVGALRIWCAKCGMKYFFRGDVGLSSYEPTVSRDTMELRFPVDTPEVIPEKGKEQVPKKLN